MKNLSSLDRVIHEPARLTLVALLSSVKSADFLFLLKESELTKGNLSVHLTRLEEAGYVEAEKTFRGKSRTLNIASHQKENLLLSNIEKVSDRSSIRNNMNYAIETNGLSKFYGDVRAVNSVDLRVGSGEIYAFLGLNGAGKTTTIRALLGMIRPSEGNVKVLGQALGPDGRGPWAKVGHLVESPSAYPELSVRENLDIARRLHGIQNPKIVDEIIERLVLASYADRKAGTLSMGNLQRLGLARALLHSPELLILDEPANGLDPAGVVEIRELLRRLVHENGVTIFMSSHILTEVDKLATRIGIIHKGKLIEELDADKLEGLRAKKLAVSARDLEGAMQAILQAGYASTKLMDHSILIEESKAIEAPDDIARILVHAGTPPTHLAVVQENLEEYFLRLTQ